jgi:hypothetical protein
MWYPGIFDTGSLIDRVQGLIVSLDSLEQLQRLDVFEGPEYERVIVQVELLNDDSTRTMEIVEVFVYRWIDSIERLDQTKDWRIEDFKAPVDLSEAVAARDIYL